MLHVDARHYTSSEVILLGCFWTVFNLLRTECSVNRFFFNSGYCEAKLSIRALNTELAYFKVLDPYIPQKLKEPHPA